MVSITSILTLLPIASAHFLMLYPPSRGFDDDKIVQYPCGGFNTITNRTQYPLTGAPIQLNLTDAAANAEVLIAMGDDPSGDDFKTILVPTLSEAGKGDFCFGDIVIPSSLGAMAGMNATIQVQTTGDSGGLYAVSSCALSLNPC